MSQIFHYFQMIRPINVLLSGITVFISAYLLNQHQYQLTLITSIVVMSFCSFANIINGLFDYDTDKINNPEKYLSTLKINSHSYIMLIVILILPSIALILGHLYFPQYAIYYLYLIFFLIIIYTPFLKGVPLIGNIIISFILASIFIITELILLNKFNNILFYPSLLTFLLTLIREVIKDIDDLKGDQKVGINTFPVFFGIKNSKYLLSILTILLILISIYPYYLNIYDYEYLILLVLLVQIPLIGCIFYLWKYPDFQSGRTLTIATKYITIGGVLVILSTKLFS